LALLVAFLVLPWGYAAGQLGGLFGLTEQQELELGRRASWQIERKIRLLEDPDVARYISQVGQKLVAVCPRPDIAYTFKVVDSRKVNAFSLPGGYVYVYRGLIEAADTESELAGVIAHEIAHIAARHSVEQLQRARLMNLGVAIFGELLGLAGPGGAAPSIAELAVTLIGTGAYLSYSREAEAEADRIGVQMLYDADYTPESFVTFLEKLEARRRREPLLLEAFFSTHPSPAQRRAAVGAILARMEPRPGAIRNTRRFQLVKSLLKRLPPPARALVAAAPFRPDRLVRVESYRAPPGEWGLHAYLDETGRQLVDGRYGTDNVDADLGGGRGYEWVAWRQAEPRILFDFGRPRRVQAVRIHIHRRSDRKIEPPALIRVFFSTDGRTITYSRVKTTRGMIFLDGRSRSVRIPTPGAEGRYVVVEMLDGDPERWIFLDEVLFEAG
jgi:Zn-dependent protease with chaperone function